MIKIFQNVKIKSLLALVLITVLVISVAPANLVKADDDSSYLVAQVDEIALDKSPVNDCYNIGDYFYLDASLFSKDSSKIDSFNDKRYYHLIQWQSSDNKILEPVELNSLGNFIVNGYGTVTITATVGDKSDSVAITIKPINEYVDNGEVIANEKHLFTYTNKCMKNGIYNMRFSPASPYKITDDEICIAMELNSEYLYQAITNVKYDGKKLQDYDWTPLNFERNSDKIYVGFEIEGSKNYKSLINKTDKKADQIINKIITYGMTDEEKLKAIFSYLIINCKLYSIIEKDKRGEIIDNFNYTPYNVLVKNKGNIAGFSRAFNLLARKVGIQCMTIGEGNGLGFLGGVCYNAAIVNNKIKYFDLSFTLNIFKPGKVTEGDKKNFLNNRLKDNFMKSYSKKYYEADKRFDTRYLKYVVVENE